MLTVNKENAAKAIRFLKIANLLPCWVEYIETKAENPRWKEHHTTKHWSDKEAINDVFGNTRFTNFLLYTHRIKTKDSFVTDIFKTYLALIKCGKIFEAEKYVKKSFIKEKT